MIRQIELEDCATIRAIEKKATGRVAFTRGAEDFLEPIANFGFIAEMNGRQIGYILCSTYHATGTAALMHMAVQPEHQRQGVGTALLTKVKARFPSYAKMKLVFIVPDTNTVAHLFL